MNVLVFACVMGDIICALAGLVTAFLFITGSVPLTAEYNGLDIFRFAVFVLIVLFSSSLTGIYNLDKVCKGFDIVVRIIFSLAISLVILLSFLYLLPQVIYWRGIIALSLALFGLYQCTWHTFFSSWAKSSGFAERVLIMGAGPLAEQIGNLIASPASTYVLAGYLNSGSDQGVLKNRAAVSHYDSILETVKKERANKIVVSLPELEGAFPLQSMLNCKISGIEVVDAPSFYEKMTGKLLLEHITPNWVVFSHGFRLKSLLRLAKRILDITVAFLGLALMCPFLFVVAVMIKLDSPGPVLFRQRRIGERDQDFTLFKFRTMRRDAENATGAVWAQENDPRVTRTGRFMRTRHIDEIPQLLNILRGDMSLVGPRPERPEFVAELKKIIPYYSERHCVKPGLTGWAQVSYPYGASVYDSLEKLRYDMYYIKNWSLSFDLAVLIETVKVVILGKGGR